MVVFCHSGYPFTFFVKRCDFPIIPLMREIDKYRNDIVASSKLRKFWDDAVDYWIAEDLRILLVKREPLVSGFLVARFYEYIVDVSKEAIAKPPYAANKAKIACAQYHISPLKD